MPEPTKKDMETAREIVESRWSWITCEEHDHAGIIEATAAALASARAEGRREFAGDLARRLEARAEEARAKAAGIADAGDAAVHSSVAATLSAFALALRELMEE